MSKPVFYGRYTTESALNGWLKGDKAYALVLHYTLVIALCHGAVS